MIEELGRSAVRGCSFGFPHIQLLVSSFEYNKGSNKLTGS